MGEVKRWTPEATERWATAEMYEDDSGEWVSYDDYARLERERDHYKALHDETMPVLEAAQGLRNRLESTERAMATQADELTRLRAVEAAALNVLEGHATRPDGNPGYLSWAMLAEACGRKG